MDSIHLEEKILHHLKTKIKNNQLVFPSMPDVFLQVKKIVDNPSSNMDDISMLDQIGSDIENARTMLGLS